MPQPANQPDHTAIVIGASMAGLLAARVLADHHDRVVLMEKDTLPPPGKNRKSVPQGRHIHVLLERGRQVIERRLPGLTADLLRAGARDVDASKDVSWFHSGFYKRAESDELRTILVSRPTLEAAVRSRVLAHPNVQLFEGCKVLRPEMEDGRRVACVRFTRDGGGEEVMAADLVVDAGGRGSRSPAWLESLGYPRPSEEGVHIGLGYTTCVFRRKPNKTGGLSGLIIMASPASPRSGVLLEQDGDRWIASVGGILGDHAPTDYAGFLDFARQLPAHHIYNAIKDEEPLIGPYVYKFPASLRRRYDTLPRFPKGYLVTGDALCSFNPIYGQGMTVAALEADALGKCLDGGRQQLAKRFFDRAARIINVPWKTAIGTDLAFPRVKGRRTPMLRFINWYLGHMHRAACRDAEVSVALLKVINMVAPPPSILHPRIAWRILRDRMRPDAAPETPSSVPGRRSRRPAAK